MTDLIYTGRFAPSPTGPLHFGSLYAALASYLDAKANKGKWLVRIEDIDTQRAVEGASDSILETLFIHGLVPDEPVVYQSQHVNRYREYLQFLFKKDLCFFCQCSRSQLHGKTGYPGQCREHKKPIPKASIRIKATEEDFKPFIDRRQNIQTPSQLDPGCQNDFILKRKDGFFSYQFACVIDDIVHGVTDVVRGIDIMDSTFKQRFLYQCFNLPTPNYLHIPIIVNNDGRKLSKQNLATPVDNHKAIENLLFALQALKQKQPPKRKSSHIDQILRFAIDNWQPELIPNARLIPQQELI